jgi:hypothetical protein
VRKLVRGVQIVEHFEAVRCCESYRALPRPLVDEVAGAACDALAGALAKLASLSTPPRHGAAGNGDGVGSGGGGDDGLGVLGGSDSD